MATTRTFSNMLNEYAPVKLLFEDLKKRDWLLSNVEQDESWLGGNLIIPFLGAVASSVSFGSLTASADIGEEITVRGQLSAYAEAHFSMKFNETDLIQHGKFSEQNFLKIIPDAIERHSKYGKGVISQSLLTGAYVAKATGNGTAGGLITVAQPDRFAIGQKVQVDDDDSSPVTGYVKTIDMNVATNNLFIVTARGGAVAVDLSAYTVAQNATIYQDNQQANGFTSLKSQLLSLANGGATNHLGVAKTAYPFLQAINVSGADITASNILSKIFSALVRVAQLGGGNPSKAVMSYKNYGSCLMVLESQKGAFNIIPGSKKVQTYGWMEITVGGAMGALDLVAIQEMDDSEIYFLDMSSICFYTNGGMRRRKGPDGQEYHPERNTSGFVYIVDHSIYGDLVVKQPSYNGVLYGISY